jgi:hypothetical protein
MSANIEKRAAFPLQSTTIENPFEQWGLDVVVEINPNSSKLHKYVLTTTDYFTKWTKAVPLKSVNENEVIQFLQRNIVTRFEVPNSLVFDNAAYFSSIKLVEYELEHNIILKYSTNYYPQGNGVVESTNKKLLRIIKKTVAKYHRDLHISLDAILWEDRATPRISLGTSPYFLVYGKEAILPQNICLPSLQLVQSSHGQSSNFLQCRIDALLKSRRKGTKLKKHFMSTNKELRDGLINMLMVTTNFKSVILF